jgi:DNA polymerase I
MNKKILLVDGSNLVFRAYFALQRSNLTSKSGKPSGAIYGFVRMLSDAILKEKPDSVLVAFDPSITFRHEKYAYYKANRPTETPADLIEQFPEIQKFLTALGIPCFKMDNIEADDMIGSVSHQASKKGFECLIFSGDKDNFQLVNDHVKILYPDIKGGYKVLDSQGVKEKLGVLPGQVIDFKALSGDSSDNIKGVPGVGPKTAQNLLEKYKNLDSIYRELGDITPNGVKEKLTNNKDSAYESQWLATIKLDAQVPFDYENFTLSVNENDAIDFLDEYGMNSIRKQLPDVVKVFLPDSEIRFENNSGLFEEENSPTTPSKFIVKQIEKLDQVPQNIDVGVSFGEEKSTLAWIADYKNLKFETYSTNKQEIFELLKKQNRVFVWNSKNVLYKHGYDTQNVFDNHIGLFVENNLQPLDAETKCKEICGEGFGLDHSIQQILIGSYLMENLEKKPLELFLRVENPLIQVLAKMEQVGVYLESKKLEDLSKTLLEKAENLTKSIKRLLNDQEININSSQQLGEKLTQMGFKLPLTGKTKNYSTDREALENLLDDDKTGLIQSIIDYRTVIKLSSSFIEAFLDKIDRNSRIHTEYSQVVAATGRLSSSNPNLQNIPIRNSEYGPLIRACFAAPKGSKIIAADYSQMELRLLAHFSNDKALQKAFQDGEDIHARTAAEMFEKPINQVTKDERAIGKTLNFALVYQQGAFSTAKQLGITQSEAKKYIELYFDRFPKVKPYVEIVLQSAKEKGYAETLFGRRRYFKNLSSKVFMLRSLDERAAFNAGLQGSGADMIKQAMIEIQNEIETKNLKSKMVLQVHDELVFEVPENEIEEIKKIIQKGMGCGDMLQVPTVVDIGVGENWAEAK